MHTTARSVVKLLFLLAILSTAILSSALKWQTNAAPAKASQPIWEVDLTKYGFQGRPPILRHNADTWGVSTYQQGVVFTDNQVVVAFFVVRDDPPGAPVGSKASPSDPYRLVAVFLNAVNGELIQKHGWAVPSTSQDVEFPYLFATTNGRLVVGNEDSFSLYSRDLQILAKHDASAPGVGMGLVVSPAGDTALTKETQRMDGKWISHFDLLDTERLSTIASWRGDPLGNEMLWGNEIATKSLHTLYFKTPETAVRVIPTSKDLCDSQGFINKDAIAFTSCGSPDRLFLVSTADGRIIQAIELGSEQMDGPPVASQNGRRFAIPTNHWGLANDNPKKLYARVFDVEGDMPILKLEVAPHYTASPNFYTPEGDTRFGWGGLALSPDGELLAVKSGPIVQLYQLPELGRARECIAPCGKTGEAPSSASGNSAEAAATAKALWPSTPPPRPPASLVQQALSWLPADTETVTAANGPFPLPELNRDAAETSKTEESEDIASLFRSLPIGLFGFQKGVIGNYFKDEKIDLAIEGARHFRSPSGLGGGPYEGADILCFSTDISARAKSFMQVAPKIARRMEEIDGEAVAVFQEPMENDTWTFYVTFPKPTIAVAATDRAYLREVLARIRGKSGPRALSENLPEWKHADTHAAFWALRHYDRDGAGKDPTSPFGGKQSANFADEEAIGLTFSFDPVKSPFATLTYFGGGKNAMQEIFSQIKTEPGALHLDPQYREIEPSVFQGRYNLAGDESAQIFIFVLLSLLGHAIYL
jgi:hypothetical protein